VIRRESVHHAIIDGAAVGEHQRAVLSLIILQAGDIVAGHVLQQRPSLGATNLNFPHVAHVKEPGRRAHRKVLAGNAGILHRHVPAAVIHHLGATRPMGGIQGCALQRGARRSDQADSSTFDALAVRYRAT
jgi:hypothetical protein